MLINKLGEFGLIEKFRRKIKIDSTVVAGSGDDCAVLKLDKKRYQLFTCDMLVEDVDFTSRTDPYLVGRKLVAVSVSDIAACCGIPRYLVASMGIPKNTTLRYVERVFQGALDLAKRFKVNFVGGDISRADKLVLDASMLGVVEKQCLTLRSGAKMGDIIFVTGSLGGSIRGKHLKFIPRLKQARFLARNFKPSAMIDISDGLADDLGHIMQSSGAGAEIYEELIPLDKQARNFSEALYMGEDFELLFTLPRRLAGKILKRKIPGYKPIGEILDKKYGLRLVEKNGREKAIASKGFRHF
ncbi:MAG: thiamine-phosphate kinase [Candidatus Omnitrophota bacterium]|nr:thiamine-phosphate kinase [Candidatus Omnitrophota bacterium]